MESTRKTENKLLKHLGSFQWDGYHQLCHFATKPNKSRLWYHITQRDSIEKINTLEHLEFSSQRFRIHQNNQEQNIRTIIDSKGSRNSNPNSSYKKE